MNNRKLTVSDPVYEYDDPDRLAFVTANAVSLLKERDQTIRLQRARLAQLESTITGLKNDNARLRAPKEDQ